jgi:hypothetical protein
MQATTFTSDLQGFKLGSLNYRYIFIASHEFQIGGMIAWRKIKASRMALKKAGINKCRPY